MSRHAGEILRWRRSGFDTAFGPVDEDEVEIAAVTHFSAAHLSHAHDREGNRGGSEAFGGFRAGFFERFLNADIGEQRQIAADFGNAALAQQLSEAHAQGLRVAQAIQGDIRIEGVLEQFELIPQGLNGGLAIQGPRIPEGFE